VEKVIKSFHSSRKPIAVSSQGGILVAGVLGKHNNGPGVQVTVGKAEKELFDVVNSFGNKALDSANIVVDEQNAIVSSGGNLISQNVDPLDLNTSICSLVDEALKLAKK
jgi:enhancing lycopene biosynthesis protein 2